MSAAPLTFYGFPLSGHSHRVALMPSLLDVPHRHVEVDLRGGAQKRPEFLALNAFGQVPVIDDNGVVVADSTAILAYLCKRYGGQAWLPEDAVGAAA
ncbi:glutathione S-transferase N-terminal domain-containing protein, partial [Achromobacter xylosoxidans]